MPGDSSENASASSSNPVLDHPRSRWELSSQPRYYYISLQSSWDVKRLLRVVYESNSCLRHCSQITPHQKGSKTALDHRWGLISFSQMGLCLKSACKQPTVGAPDSSFDLVLDHPIPRLKHLRHLSLYLKIYRCSSSKNLTSDSYGL